MDSYDLFGEDGTGMLEGLADLGSDNFDDNAAPVGGAPRDAPNQPGLVFYSLFCFSEAGRKQSAIISVDTKLILFLKMYILKIIISVVRLRVTLVQ